MEILKLLQPYSQGSLLLALRSSVGRVGENPGNEVETFIALCIPVQSGNFWQKKPNTYRNKWGKIKLSLQFQVCVVLLNKNYCA